MYSLTYWEIFGIVLVTLYFVLSLLFPKTENSKKEQQKPVHDTKSLPSTSGGADHKKGPEKSLLACREQREDEVCSSNAHRERTSYNQQEVRRGSNKNDSLRLKHQDIACFSNDGVSPILQDVNVLGKDTPIQPLQSYLCETPSDVKLSELGHDSVSTLKPPQESLQCSTNSELHDDENESRDQDPHNPCEQLSNYLSKEFENNNEGLPANDVCIAEMSNSDNKFCGNIASSEGISFQSENLDAGGFVSPVDTEKVNSSNEITSNLKNNNNLEKFADGLATSAIETAVDNSICLNNFAENLSEKIFWASADDVISEVHANIEKKNKEGAIEAMKLESLSRNVASEVVNEAVGEAALREEYMTDKIPERASSKIQPHLGYVVENVVNNAICEAALRLKEGEIGQRETEDFQDNLHILESESSNVSAPLSSSAATECNDTVAFHKEESGKLLEYSSNKQKEDTEIQSPDLQIPNNKAELRIESKGHATDTCLEDEKFVIPAENQTVEINEGITCDKEVSKLDFPQGQGIQLAAGLKAQEVKFGIHEQGSETGQVFHEQITEKDFSAESDVNSPLPFKDQEITSAKDVSSKEFENELVYNNEKESDPVGTIKVEESSIISNRRCNDEKVVREWDDKPLETAQVSLTTNEADAETQNQISTYSEKEDIVQLDKEGEDVTESSNLVTMHITNQAEFKAKVDNQNNSVPDIKLFPDKVVVTQTSSESDEIVSPTSLPNQPDTATLRERTDNKESFWRRSLILDLEEDFEPEDSISSGPSSPGSPKTFEQRILSEGSEELTDSEEDEIIDHDADAQLGAVGGSNQPVAQVEFDLYDYGSEDESDDDTFEPVLTIDGLCASKHSKEKSKRGRNLKSVGLHYNRAIVMDNGCGYIKLGYAGDRRPRVDQQSVFGIPPRYSIQITGLGTNLRDFKKFGSEAVSKAGVMHLSHPMRAGMINDWTDVEDIWEHMIYNELGVEEDGDNPIIMTEISQNSKKNREKITEILFEHFHVPAMYLADQLPLSIYASGLTSGLCLSSGFSCSQAGVVYEGHTLSYTVQHLDIGGGDLTENLKILLRDNRGHNFTTSSGWQIVNDIKETISFVAKDYNSEVQKFKTNDALTKFYTLPDGQVIDIGYECMSSVEPLFQPDELMSADATTASQSPVHQLVGDAIMRCDKDLQQICHNQVILSGGTTLLKGFTPRLQHELHRINHKIRKIRAPEHRRHSSWIGGSILGTLSTFEEQYVTMDEYGDSGPRIVHKKCF